MGEEGDWSAIDAALEKERRSMHMNVVGCSSSGNAIFNIFHRAQAKQASVDEAERPGSSSDSRCRAQGSGEEVPVELSHIERFRARKHKLPEGPRGRAKAVRITKESAIPISQRLMEFPDEGFKNSAGKIFCVPCRERIQNNKQGIKRHIESVKHTAGLEALRRSMASDVVLSKDLSDYFKTNPHERGVSVWRSLLYLSRV